MPVFLLIFLKKEQGGSICIFFLTSITQDKDLNSVCPKIAIQTLEQALQNKARGVGKNTGIFFFHKCCTIYFPRQFECSECIRLVSACRKINISSNSIRDYTMDRQRTCWPCLLSSAGFRFLVLNRKNHKNFECSLHVYSNNSRGLKIL